MKRSLLAALFSMVAALALVPVAHAQSARVVISGKLTEVEATSSRKAEKEEGEKLAGTITSSGKSSSSVKARPVKVDIDVSKLDLKLASSTVEGMDGLTVKWWIVGRSARVPGLKVIKDGSVETSIPAGKPVEISSDPVETKYIYAYVKSKERISASGDKVSGWAVQVFRGETKVGESYSSPDVQKVVTATPE